MHAGCCSPFTNLRCTRSSYLGSWKKDDQPCSGSIVPDFPHMILSCFKRYHFSRMSPIFLLFFKLYSLTYFSDCAGNIRWVERRRRPIRSDFRRVSDERRSCYRLIRVSFAWLSACSLHVRSTSYSALFLPKYGSVDQHFNFWTSISFRIVQVTKMPIWLLVYSKQL